MVTAVTPLTLSPVPSLHWTYKHMFPSKMTASVPWICSFAWFASNTLHPRLTKVLWKQNVKTSSKLPNNAMPRRPAMVFENWHQVVCTGPFLGRVLIGLKFAPIRWGCFPGKSAWLFGLCWDMFSPKTGGVHSNSCEYFVTRPMWRGTW